MMGAVALNRRVLDQQGSSCYFSPPAFDNMLEKIGPPIVTLLFKLIGALPLPVLQRLGRFFGWLAWCLPGSYKESAKKNLHQAFPESDPRLLRAAMMSVGQLMFEMPFWWTRRNESALDATLQCDNWQQFDEALSLEKGVILLTPHLGCFEMLGPVFGARYPATVLFRPPRMVWLSDWIVKMRSRRQLTMAPANQRGVRTLVKTLLRGRIIGILPDQVPPDGEGVWAPFFGKPAYTMTLVQRLQHLSGAPIFVLAAERKAVGKGYTLHYKRLDAPLPSEPEAAATIINQEMEALIRKMPEQYLWGYNRYRQPKIKAAKTNGNH
jgi:Kdo2-lipid IVA lauroyltransferase/acyltransferase